MPNGMAVIRMTPRNSNPENTWFTAGSGTEKPNPATASASLPIAMPPKLKPKIFEPQAMTVPTMIATKPAGMPLGYLMPQNQLTRMMAKQTNPITGVMYISSAGRMEM